LKGCTVVPTPADWSLQISISCKSALVGGTECNLINRDEASSYRCSAARRCLAVGSRTMPVDRRALFRFITLYLPLFSAFGFASPFLPAFLAGRGLGPEEVGFVLGAATALRLVSGPIAGRLA